jgi:hypothetical protein
LTHDPLMREGGLARDTIALREWWFRGNFGVAFAERRLLRPTGTGCFR